MNRIIISKSNNPYLNLSYEESLLSEIQKGEAYFFLWQNAHTIVIGKHQNPWAEIYTDTFKQEKGTLARRMTGGGAVYQDMGNLNFTFVLPREDIDLEKQLSVIIKALSKHGIKAEFSGRNDILIDGKKFSGNAFYKGKTNYIHHGTIMYDVDLSKLGLYLNVSEKKLKSKGVSSVKSRVTNLVDVNEDLKINELIDSLCDSFEEIYSKAVRETIDVESLGKKAGDIYKKYSSDEWIYGKTPEFDYEIKERFDWGEISIQFKLISAKIKEVKIYSDAMDALFIEELSQKLESCDFKLDAILDRLDDLAQKQDYKSMIDEIKDLIKNAKDLNI